MKRLLGFTGFIYIYFVVLWLKVGETSWVLTGFCSSFLALWWGIDGIVVLN